MEVYVVTNFYEYECTDVVGVYPDEQTAIRFMDEAIKRDTDNYYHYEITKIEVGKSVDDIYILRSEGD